MSITDTQISQLRGEAEEAGDLEQVAICMIALGADRSEGEPGTALAECTLSRDDARAECERVIAEAMTSADRTD